MRDTLIIQSHRSPLPYAWIDSCLQSVRDWSETNQYNYRFIGDELFDVLPKIILDKIQLQKVIVTDLARLLFIQEALNDYASVVWLDADFLIFDPEQFILPNESYAVGREVWVQQDQNGKLKVYKKVHNAFLLFRRGNSFLNFYVDTAERLLLQNQGSMPPQFIGPKLLTALHNVVQLPVMETAGMLSPLVIKDLIAGEGPALSLFRQQSISMLAAANLCASSCDRDDIAVAEMEKLIGILTTE